MLAGLVTFAVALTKHWTKATERERFVLPHSLLIQTIKAPSQNGGPLGIVCPQSGSRELLMTELGSLSAFQSRT